MLLPAGHRIRRAGLLQRRDDARLRLIAAAPVAELAKGAEPPRETDASLVDDAGVLLAAREGHELAAAEPGHPLRHALRFPMADAELEAVVEAKGDGAAGGERDDGEAVAAGDAARALALGQVHANGVWAQRALRAHLGGLRDATVAVAVDILVAVRVTVVVRVRLEVPGQEGLEAGAQHLLRLLR